MKITKIIDIYRGGILDGKEKEWDVDTYVKLNSYSMEYTDNMISNEISHTYGIDNNQVDIYKLSRKYCEENCIKCIYTHQNVRSKNSLELKIDNIIKSNNNE